MLIEVIRYNRFVGNDNIRLPYYQILPEDAEEYEKTLSSLLEKGIDKSVMYSVELPLGVIDYEANMIKYPNLGLKRHISAIMGNDKYCKILKEEKFSIKDYMN